VAKKWPTITGAYGAWYNAYTMSTCWQLGPPGLRDSPPQAKNFVEILYFSMNLISIFQGHVGPKVMII
jgi:hypothetical protein